MILLSLSIHSAASAVIVGGFEAIGTMRTLSSFESSLVLGNTGSISLLKAVTSPATVRRCKIVSSMA